MWQAGLEERCALLQAAIRANAAPSQLKAIVKQLLWSSSDGSPASAIERADALLADAKSLTGTRHDSLAGLQRELTARGCGALAKRVGVLKGGRLYAAHGDPSLEEEIHNALVSPRRRM